jgi:hypothetical protein
LSYFEIDTNSGNLVGIGQGADGLWALSILDTQTGSSIQVGAGLSGIVNGVHQQSAIDSGSGIYYHNTPNGILAIDINSGLILDTYQLGFGLASMEFTPVPLPPAGFFFISAIAGLVARKWLPKYCHLVNKLRC